MRYQGPSMAPTLIPGDVLCVAPLAAPPVVGEVVVFHDQSGRRVVHRVRAVEPGGGLVTQGDAYPQPDEEPVAPERVIGRVASVLRRGSEIPMPPRGAAGRARGRLRGAAGALYYWLSGAAPLRRALRALLRPRLSYLRCTGPSGEVKVVVVHRGRTVAWLYPQSGRMRSRFPFALLVDPPRSLGRRG
jgi:hypothetical protein